VNHVRFKKKGGPARPFMHADNCKIMKADPTAEIPWQEIEASLWVAECECGKEYEREAPRPCSDRPVRPGHLPARGRVRAPGHDRPRSDPGDPECSGTSGRGLPVGAVWRLRPRLAGFALLRGERRVATNPLPRRATDRMSSPTARAAITPPTSLSASVWRADDRHPMIAATNEQLAYVALRPKGDA
jgi:hypothetical protein